MKIFITMTNSYYDDKIDIGYFKTYEDAVLDYQKSFYQPRAKWSDLSYWTNVKWIRTVDLDAGYHSDEEVIRYYSIDN